MSGTALRVVVVHNRYRSSMPSGEDRVVDREIALLARAGHTVDLFERRSDDIAAMPLPRKALVPLQVPWNGGAQAELAHLLRDRRPDVVHIHNTFPLLSPSVLAACVEAGVPAVATLHNYSLVCPVGTMVRDGAHCAECVEVASTRAVRHKCYRGSRLATVPAVISMATKRKWWLSGAVTLLCVSESQRAKLVASGVPGEKLGVKPHFVPDPGTRRSGSGEYVLYLGRMTEEKGLRLLMAAWDVFRAQGGPDIPLVMVGDGSMRQEVGDWASARPGVSYLGLRSETECQDLLARSIALVAPSTMEETFGLVVAEAMAAGVPVVAAGHGGFADIVQDGVTGFLHEPNNVQALVTALHRVSHDPSRNDAMGKASRQAYEERFSPEIGLAALVRCYRTVMKQPDSSGPS
ncbi:glycosyltransferase [Pseudonocardia yuanmonensis]|uniref:Glycosyltransferase n=1 Tax=Pseudonocardia yuanmonensis TaxID=1095914 RepID=A0ABP8VX88_9PSEU